MKIVLNAVTQLLSFVRLLKEFETFLLHLLHND